MPFFFHHGTFFARFVMAVSLFLKSSSVGITYIPIGYTNDDLTNTSEIVSSKCQAR
jgi:hypothetical protein